MRKSICARASVPHVSVEMCMCLEPRIECSQNRLNMIAVVAQVLIGSAEGCNYPSQIALVSRWVPDQERTTAWNCLTAGEAAGTIVAMLSSPWLAAHGGWPMIFYVSGGLGVARPNANALATLLRQVAHGALVGMMGRFS